LSAVETGNFAYIRDILERDYATWSGRILERFFHEMYAASGNFNRIGTYWERGNKNEIDLVAVNDLKKEIVIAEIKVNKNRINLSDLEKKAKNLCDDYQGYRFEFRALSIEDAAISFE
jgi:predicted AAA+ superfamily ATPase